MVRPDRKMAPASGRISDPRAELVLENSSGEDHRVESVSFAKFGSRRSRDPRAIPRWKAHAICRDLPAAQPILADASEQGPEIEFAAIEGERIRRIPGCAPRAELFEPHGGLPFEAHLSGKTQQRSRSIEQPSRRSRREACGDPCGSIRERIPIALGKIKGRRAEIGDIVELRQESGGRLHRDIRAAASPPGNRRRAQMSDTIEAFL